MLNYTQRRIITFLYNGTLSSKFAIFVVPMSLRRSPGLSVQGCVGIAVPKQAKRNNTSGSSGQQCTVVTEHRTGKSRISHPEVLVTSRVLVRQAWDPSETQRGHMEESRGRRHVNRGGRETLASWADSKPLTGSDNQVCERPLKLIQALMQGNKDMPQREGNQWKGAKTLVIRQREELWVGCFT